jgi:hypothetical protein
MITDVSRLRPTVARWSWIARKDDPGTCPGEDWQVVTLPGKRGHQGPRGERGEKGDRGPPGQSAPFVASWIVERASYSVLPILSDGAEGPRLELRPLFEQFDAETAPRNLPFVRASMGRGGRLE